VKPGVADKTYRRVTGTSWQFIQHWIIWRICVFSRESPGFWIFWPLNPVLPAVRKCFFERKISNPGFVPIADISKN